MFEVSQPGQGRRSYRYINGGGGECRENFPHHHQQRLRRLPDGFMRAIASSLVVRFRSFGDHTFFKLKTSTPQLALTTKVFRVMTMVCGRSEAPKTRQSRRRAKERRGQRVGEIIERKALSERETNAIRYKHEFSRNPSKHIKGVAVTINFCCSLISSISDVTNQYHLGHSGMVVSFPINHVLCVCYSRHPDVGAPHSH